MTRSSPSDSGAYVLVERTDAVGVVKLNNEGKRNAMDLDMRKSLSRAVLELTQDDAIRVIVITGGDKVFSAGADLSLLVDKGPQQVAALNLLDYWGPVAECPKPVIAAVSGYAFGAGCELALMCDTIIADETARFGQPECNVGIMPGAGGVQRLVRLVGKSVASAMIMTGKPLNAKRAYELGFISDLVPAGEAVSRACETARLIANKPPLAIAAIKRTLKAGADLPLNEALLIENREFLLLFDTADKSEGMNAFLEKREPVFTGE